jgi:hypothetical protein
MQPWDFFDYSASLTSSSIFWQTHDDPESLEHSTITAGSLMTEALRNGVKAEDISETTSFCSWAFSLVLRNNAKAYSVADLHLKLQMGYRFGATPTEGCRVDNKTLLTVLAEISMDSM